VALCGRLQATCRGCLPFDPGNYASADLPLPCTRSVCPFYSSRADIVPSQYVNPTWAAYPPKPEKLGELYELVRTLCPVVCVTTDTT
jgi:hypothetical protein